MDEKDANKLAKKIKRVFNTIPDDVVVFITDSTITIHDYKEYRNYVAANGHHDNPPYIVSVNFDANVVGNNEQL